MTDFQKAVKYFAIILAILLIISIISGILSILGVMNIVDLAINGSVVTDEEKEYTYNDDEIMNLDIDISASELTTVVNGDSFSVRSNLKDLKVTKKGSTLKITEKGKFSKNYSGAYLIISIPENKIFEDVKIDSGAGVMDISSLRCESLELDLGAGDLKAKEIFVYSECEINGGAGKISVRNSEFNDLSLDMGVGKLELSAALKGVSDFDLGVGNAEITICGKKEDYRVKISKGLGSVSIEGTDLKDGTVIGDGKNRINIDCGVGKTTVEYKEEQDAA